MSELSEESKIIEFRTRVIEQLKTLHGSIEVINQSFIEYKLGIGKRLEHAEIELTGHDKRLLLVESSVANLLKVAWLIAMSSAGIIITAFWNLVLKK